MDQSYQGPFSDTNLGVKEQGDGLNINVNKEKLKNLDPSHLQANGDTHSLADDRGGRVQPTVDVAEIIRRWTHALQRIHKQSLHLVRYCLFVAIRFVIQLAIR